MKKKILITLIAIIIIPACIFAFYKMTKKESSEYESTEGVDIALTLIDDINENTIWCGTFQLIWNDLINDIGGPVVPNVASQEMANLNEESFTEKDISENYYYKKYGKPTYELKAEIEKALKEKFDEESDILDEFNWEIDSPNARFFYTMLKKEFKFTYKFTKLDDDKFNGKGSARYFGAKAKDDSEIKNQINILYYESSEDFALVLHSETDDIIFVKKPKQNTFIDIYDAIYEKEAKYSGSKFLRSNESFKVPYISLKEKKEFEELYEKPFKNAEGAEVEIYKALQTIDFTLDETGGSIRSEAGIGVKDTASALEEDAPRILDVDSTFAMFLVEKGKNIPYYAALINDITKFQ